MAVTSSNCSLIKSCNIDSDRSILPPYKKLCNSWGKKGEINLTIEHETGHCSVYRMAKREVLNTDRSLAFDYKVAPFKSCKIIMGIQKFI